MFLGKVILYNLCAYIIYKNDCGDDRFLRNVYISTTINVGEEYPTYNKKKKG
jgi:hypothetical protein